MISEKAFKRVETGSAIRTAFNKAEKLRAIYGESEVFDLSIGNPCAPIPQEVTDTILSVATDLNTKHAYMCDAGYAPVRKKIAHSLNKRFHLCCSEKNVIMTAGAAGALNITLYTLLNPEDEVIIFAPYYPAYISFIENFSGKPIVVRPDITNFTPDIMDFKEKITAKTKAIIVNSPNNPSGAVYGKDIVQEITAVLSEKEEEFGHTIYLISDEPYRELIFNDKPIIWWPEFYRNTIVIYSFSKSLSIPGERIGYLFIPSEVDDFELLRSALRSATGALGFVNAPAFFQTVVGACTDIYANTDYYRHNRDILVNKLKKAGFEFSDPEGAFYIFLKIPGGNEKDFISAAQKHRLIFVPGSAFGLEGYVRISFCGSHETVEAALPQFDRLAENYGL